MKKPKTHIQHRDIQKKQGHSSLYPCSMVDNYSLDKIYARSTLTGLLCNKISLALSNTFDTNRSGISTRVV